MAEFISAALPRVQGRMESSVRGAFLDVTFLYLPSLTPEIVAVLEEFV
jgi:hypothetical protein